MEYREGEWQRKKESWRQASKAQREKERQRARKREKKQRRHFLCWKNNVKILLRR